MKKSLTIILATFICCAAHAQSIPDAPILGGDPSDNPIDLEHRYPEMEGGYFHEFNIWASVNVKKNFGEKWELMGRVETRSKNNCHDASRIIIRVMPTYSVCDWFKVGVGADYIANWSGPSASHAATPICRAMLDLTENFALGGVQVSVRERYMYAYDFEAKSHSHVVRAKATVSYPIAGTRLTPYAAGEIFYWGSFPQARAFAGTKVKLGDHLTFDLAYLCQVQMKSSLCNHVAKAAFTFSF